MAALHELAPSGWMYWFVIGVLVIIGLAALPYAVRTAVGVTSVLLFVLLLPLLLVVAPFVVPFDSQEPLEARLGAGIVGVVELAVLSFFTWARLGFPGAPAAYAQARGLRVPVAPTWVLVVAWALVIACILWAYRYRKRWLESRPQSLYEVRAARRQWVADFQTFVRTVFVSGFELSATESPVLGYVWAHNIREARSLCQRSRKACLSTDVAVGTDGYSELHMSEPFIVQQARLVRFHVIDTEGNEIGLIDAPREEQARQLLTGLWPMTSIHRASESFGSAFVAASLESRYSPDLRGQKFSLRKDPS